MLSLKLFTQSSTQSTRRKGQAILLGVFAHLLASLASAEMTPDELLFNPPLIDTFSLTKAIPPGKNILNNAFPFNGKKQNVPDIFSNIFNPPPEQTHLFVYPLTRVQAKGSDEKDDRENEGATALNPESEGATALDPESEGATALEPNNPDVTEIIALLPDDFSQETAILDLVTLLQLSGRENFIISMQELTQYVNLRFVQFSISPLIPNADIELIGHADRDSIPVDGEIFLMYWVLFSRILNNDGRDAALDFLRSFRDNRATANVPSTPNAPNSAQRESRDNEEYFSALSRGELPEGQPRFRASLYWEDFSKDNMQRLGNNLGSLGQITASGSLPEASERLEWFAVHWSYFAQLLNHIGLDNPESSPFDFLEIAYRRAIHPNSVRLRREYGIYYTPSREWLNPVNSELQDWANQRGTVLRGLEIFSGNGSLSRFLSSLEIQMIATGLEASHRHVTNNRGNSNLYFNVVEESAPAAVVNHPETNLLVMSWPIVGTDALLSSEQEIVNFVMGGLYVPGNRMLEGFMQNMDTMHPALAAVIRWGRRGPILFIGEHGESEDTEMKLFFAYLEKFYHAVDFKEQYKSGTGFKDYPTLYFPKDLR